MTNKNLAQLNRQLKSETDKKTAIGKSQWQLIESLLKKENDNEVIQKAKKRDRAD